MATEDVAKEVERLEDFIKEQRPDHTYLIDGPRDVPESTICRRNDEGSTNCLKLKIPSTKLFAEMVRSALLHIHTHTYTHTHTQAEMRAESSCLRTCIELYVCEN